MSISIRLRDVVEDRLTAHSAKTGHSETFYVTKAICEQVDDLEDVDRRNPWLCDRSEAPVPISRKNLVSSGARRRIGAVILAIAVVVLTPALAAALQYTVPGTTMPWTPYGKTNKHYHFGIGDGTAPIDVPLHLLHAHGGDTIVVEYVSGAVSAEPGNFPYTDADGDTSYPTNNYKNGAGRFPSYYMTPYPIYLCELVGTFTKKNGEIIGQPFAVADGPASFVVPADASVLLLGVNDNKFSDNAGSWVISISKQ